MLVPMLIAAPVVLGVSALGTWVLLSRLEKWQIFDAPGPRSSHVVPTPRGGGAVMVAIILLGWAAMAISGAAPREALWVSLCGAIIVIPSAIDDVRGLPALPRLIVQLITAAIGALVLAGPKPVFQGLVPPAPDFALTVIVWTGFINHFNFTDGIDGHAGCKAVSLGAGIAALSLLGAVPDLGALGVIAAASAAGFLIHNWHPARVFMGDVGSVPLGFLFAWLLLRTATEGHWAPALILPIVYISDTVATYGRKIVRLDRFWRPHRDYTYQRAVRAGASPAHVVKAVLAGNFVACGAAILAVSGYVAPALVIAAVTGAVVIGYLEHLARQR